MRVCGVGDAGASAPAGSSAEDVDVEETLSFNLHADLENVRAFGRRRSAAATWG